MSETETKIVDNIGATLARLRQRSGMSHDDLARAADVSVGVIKAAERGKITDLETLSAIYSALGFDTIFSLRAECEP